MIRLVKPEPRDDKREYEADERALREVLRELEKLAPITSLPRRK